MTTKRRFPAWIPGALVSLALVTALVLRTDWRAAWQAMQLADRRYLTLGLLGSLLWMSVRGWVWRSLLPLPVPWRIVFPTVNEGYLLNAVLPFRLGEIGRVYLLTQKTRLRFASVLPSVFVERATDLLFSAILLLFSFSVITLDAQTRQITWLVVILTLFSLAALYLAARFRPRWQAYLQRRFARHERLLSLSEHLFEGLSILQEPRRFARFAALMTLNWLVAVVQFWLIVRAFFPQAPLSWGLFTLVATSFGGAVPALPGAIGTLEAAIGSVIFLLTGDSNTALAVGITVRMYNYAIPLPIGFWALSRDGQSLESLYHTLRQLPKEQKA